MTYVELQVTSHFSFLRGVSSAESLFVAAALMGHRALGIVDRNSVGGLVHALRSADATGVHYAWHERSITSDGDTTTGFRKRFVSANDLAGAPRIGTAHLAEAVPGIPRRKLLAIRLWQSTLLTSARSGREPLPPGDSLPSSKPSPPS